MIYLPPPITNVVKRVVKPGFTLAELLIALAILGIIATFTIPKVLQAQQDQKYNAMAKETMAAISEAYQMHKAKGLLSSSTSAKDFAPYLNYVSVDTTSTLDPRPNGGTATCIPSNMCVRLHNGALLLLTWYSYAGTNITNGLTFVLDPDGVQTGKNDSLVMSLYYNGMLRTRNDYLPGTTSSAGGPYGPVTDGEPAWFHWGG